MYLQIFFLINANNEYSSVNPIFLRCDADIFPPHPKNFSDTAQKKFVRRGFMRARVVSIYSLYI